MNMKKSALVIASVALTASLLTPSLTQAAKKSSTSITANDASLVIKFPTSWANKKYTVKNGSTVYQTGKLNKFGNTRVYLKKNQAYRTAPTNRVTITANGKNYYSFTNLKTTTKDGSLLWFKEYYAARTHFSFDLSLIQTSADYQEVTIKQPKATREVTSQYTTFQMMHEVAVNPSTTALKTGSKHPVRAYATPGYYNGKAQDMGPVGTEKVAFYENGKPYSQIILR